MYTSTQITGVPQDLTDASRANRGDPIEQLLIFFSFGTPYTYVL